MSGNAANLENFQIVIHYNIKDIVAVEDDSRSEQPHTHPQLIIVHDNVVHLPQASIESGRVITAHLYTLQGQEVASWNAADDQRVSDLSTGMYHLLLCDDRGSVVTRIQLMKQ